MNWNRERINKGTARKESGHPTQNKHRNKIGRGDANNDAAKACDGRADEDLRGQIHSRIPQVDFPVLPDPRNRAIALGRMLPLSALLFEIIHSRQSSGWQRQVESSELADGAIAYSTNHRQAALAAATRRKLASHASSTAFGIRRRRGPRSGGRAGHRRCRCSVWRGRPQSGDGRPDRTGFVRCDSRRRPNRPRQ